MSALDVWLPSFIVPTTSVIVGFFIITRFCYGRPQKKLQPAQKGAPTIETSELMEAAGKSVLIKADLGFNDEFVQSKFKSRETGIQGWEKSIMLGETFSADPKSVPDAVQDRRHSHNVKQDSISNRQKQDFCMESIDRVELVISSECFVGTTPKTSESTSQLKVEILTPESAAFVHSLSVLMISNCEATPVPEPLVFYEPTLDLEPSTADSYPGARRMLHPDTLQPILSDDYSFDLPRANMITSPLWNNQDNLLSFHSFPDFSSAHQALPEDQLTVCYDKPRSQRPRHYIGSTDENGSPNSIAWSVQRSGSQGSQYRKKGLKKPSPKSPRRNTLMLLHEQMFRDVAAAGRPGGMSQPMLLPGESGVAMYRGAASLAGVMHSAAVEESTVHSARRTAELEDDDTWG